MLAILILWGRWALTLALALLPGGGLPYIILFIKLRSCCSAETAYEQQLGNLGKGRGRGGVGGHCMLQVGSSTSLATRWTSACGMGKGYAEKQRTISRVPRGGGYYLTFKFNGMTVWPSGLRRWLQAPVRKGVGSNPTAVKL